MDANDAITATPTATDTDNSTAAARVQHVTKKSSDELLRKFAEVGSALDDKKELRLAKRLRRSTKAGVFNQGRMYVDQSPSLNGVSVSIVERKCLLPPVVSSRRKPTLVRRLGIGRAAVRAREIKNKSILGAIEKVRFLSSLMTFSLYVHNILHLFIKLAAIISILDLCSNCILVLD